MRCTPEESLAIYDELAVYLDFKNINPSATSPSLRRSSRFYGATEVDLSDESGFIRFRARDPDL